jgi:hypothetical protein
MILLKLETLIISKKQTLAVAESVTSGLMQHAFGSIKMRLNFIRAVLQFIILDKNTSIYLLNPYMRLLLIAYQKKYPKKWLWK